MIIKKANLQFKNILSKRKKTTEIIIHCTATKEGKHFTVEQIHKMHLANGWSGIGYNYLIYLDGTIYEGRPVDCVGSHTTNHNSISVGICYVGGLDKNGKAKDTRTPAQKASMIYLCRKLHNKYPDATFHGHREYANKACPCFDVKSWIKTFSLELPSNGKPGPMQKPITASELADNLAEAFKNIFNKKNEILNPNQFEEKLLN